MAIQSMCGPGNAPILTGARTEVRTYWYCDVCPKGVWLKLPPGWLCAWWADLQEPSIFF
jgi:hypothetical protein